MSHETLSESQRHQIAEILRRRANEIAGYSSEHRNIPSREGEKMPASVEFGLSREIDRLRTLADRVDPPAREEEEEA